MSPSRVFSRVVRECWRYRLRLLLAVASMAALSLAQLSLPWIVKAWVEGPLVADATMATGGYVVAALAAVAGIAVLLLLSRAVLASLNQGVMASVRDAAMERVLAAEPPVSGSFATGEVMSRIMQDAGLLGGFVEQGLKRLLANGILAAGAMVMMFVLCFRLALAGCLVAPLVAWLLVRLGSAIRGRSAAAQRAMGEFASALQEQLSGLTTIKAYQTEEQEQERFGALNRAYWRLVVGTDVRAALLVAAVFLVVGGAFVAATLVGTGELKAGRMTYGGLVAFCMYAGFTVEPLRRLADAHGLIQRSLAGAARLFELVDLPLTADQPVVRAMGEDPPRAPASPNGVELRLERLAFRYRPDEPVLEGLDLNVGAGESLALVAASGGGKSTLARLLLRFHEPAAGRITLSGNDLSDLPLSAVRRTVCVAFQEPFLFSGSLADNIAYGTPRASSGAVLEAARLAGLAGLLEGRASGLAAPVFEAGRDLSGGQRQRIALARVILRNPPLLVLDEALSALDGEREAEIFAALEGWLARRTVIVMAHRLSTVRRLGRVVVLHDGRVAGDGSFSQLENSCGVFRELLGDQVVGDPVDSS